MVSHILIHYSEIYLKGRNRSYFEDKLIENIEQSLSDLDQHSKVIKILGRIAIKLKEGADKKEYKRRLKQVPGIANFSFCVNVQQDIEKIKQISWNRLRKRDFDTFAVDTNRANKDFEQSSQQVNDEVGGYIDTRSDASVDLDQPERTLYIEIVEDYAFVYDQKIEGSGGLPVGSTGRVLSLVSSGIDSPVASWKMMRRGCKVDFCHFHSFPFTDKKVQVNVERIIKKLSEWQSELDVYFVNLHDIQKEIIKLIDEKYRLLLYRREMFRLSEMIAEKEGIKGLVTGESVGQVASQTLENMRVTSAATQLPIYRPNVGSHKQEITDKAKELGTYEVSIEDVEDCCTYMVADHPETRAELEQIREVEQNLDLDQLRNEAIEKMEHKTINN
ncbi:MAG: tRNA uracil 4-sulfurtransferase ThiI [Candidatus Paceibacteria bacterium]